tara:strand:- start:9025 stop:9876 length:852 start_codon:yes stop_codon:yes gene_type:complete
MKLIEFRSYFRNELKKIYTLEESDDFLKRIIHSYFDWESVKLGLEPDYQLTYFEENKLNSALISLKKEKPLQYILGITNFFNLELEVNSSVLIPRPETEELVDWILQKENSLIENRLLDIGTGSGCIPIALKKEIPSWQISAIDISGKALDVAKRNAINNNVKIEFHLMDILGKVNWYYDLDIIVSNPPYVVPSEKNQMRANILDYEPELALFVPEEDPLLFYKSIIEFARENLNPKGILYFEINPIFVNELYSIIRNYNFEIIEVKKDFLKNPRMIRAVKSN